MSRVAGLEEFLRGPSVLQAHVRVGRRRHALERVEKMELALGRSAPEQRESRSLHAPAPPHPALDDLPRHPDALDVAQGLDHSEELDGPGHRPGRDRLDDATGLFIYILHRLSVGSLVQETATLFLLLLHRLPQLCH